MSISEYEKIVKIKHLLIILQEELVICGKLF